MKGHHDHDTSSKGKHFLVLAHSAVVQSVILIVGPGSMQSDMVPET